ncbi:MAG: TetR/AcrR family transcriptional regulator [Flavobacteriaceae bacterium]|jgi:AcrR family transcriptional regulator|nr:TetR/AcrR family transcriptional regulator [Flavobacteriaceae bacterium]
MDSLKERIISKSLELFTNVGVKGVTMDMISEELRMSKRTLYEHFPGKEELIKQTFSESLSSSITELENRIKNYQSIIQQKFMLLENLQNLFFIKKNKTSFQLEKFYPEIYKEILNIQKQCIKTQLRNNITLGIEEGVYRSKINKKLVMEYFYLVEQIIMNENISSNPALDKNSKIYFIGLLIRSIATKKGIKELEKIIKIN